MRADVAVLAKRPTEIWFDEFVGSPQASSHAFLLAPEHFDSLRSAGEFKIAFETFDFTQVRAEGRR